MPSTYHSGGRRSVPVHESGFGLIPSHKGHKTAATTAALSREEELHSGPPYSGPDCRRVSADKGCCEEFSREAAVHY